MLKITSFYALTRTLAALVFCTLVSVPATLWSQAEAQAATEPMVLSSQTGRSKLIPQGKSITVSGFPDNRFSVKGRLIGVSKDHVHLLTDARGSERATIKIDDIGRVSRLRIGWLIAGAVMLLYLGGFSIGILLGIGSAGTAAVVALAIFFFLIFGIPTILAIRAGFVSYNMTKWKIQRGR